MKNYNNEGITGLKRFILILFTTLIVTACLGCNSTGDTNNNSQDTTTIPNTNTATQTTDNKQEEYKIMIKELIIKNGEKEIYGKIYRPEGDGKFPAVILSHGYNGAHSDFTKECQYFAKNGYIAYAYDFCGGSTRSKSSGKSTDMTIFTEKEDLLAVFDYISAMPETNPEQVYLFGGSQGGLATALATEERADKVKGVILYYPALNIPDDWRRNYASVDAIPDTVDFWGLKLGKNFFVSMREFDTFKNIGSFQKNVLIIHGDKDNIVPLSYSEKAITIYSNAELIVLPGEGHGYSSAGGQTAMEKALEFMQ